MEKAYESWRKAMGLAHRIIPTVLVKGRSIVKGQQFRADRVVGHAAQFVRIQQRREVDELVILDVTATPEGRGPDLGLVSELSEVVFAPLAVGGGIRNLGDARALLLAGADKVIIGTGGARVIKEIADVVGSQAVVAAIDYRGVQVHTHCGSKATRYDPLSVAHQVYQAGAGEILLTSIDRDGMLRGYDLKMIEMVAREVPISVIAHGGCRDYGDMVDAIHAGASAVAAGALFQFCDATPREAAKALASYGIEVRL